MAQLAGQQGFEALGGGLNRSIYLYKFYFINMTLNFENCFSLISKLSADFSRCFMNQKADFSENFFCYYYYSFHDHNDSSTFFFSCFPLRNN